MRIKFEIGIGSECPHCKTGTITYKKGKYGDFYGCTRFPHCAFTQKITEVIEDDDIYDDNDDEDDDSGLVFNSKYNS